MIKLLITSGFFAIFSVGPRALASSSLTASADPRLKISQNVHEMLFKMVELKMSLEEVFIGIPLLTAPNSNISPSIEMLNVYINELDQKIASITEDELGLGYLNALTPGPVTVEAYIQYLELEGAPCNVRELYVQLKGMATGFRISLRLLLKK